MRQWINLFESHTSIIVAYHGTQDSFDQFAHPLHQYDPGEAQLLGFWFTSSPDAAKIFANDDRGMGDGQPRLLTVQLKLGRTLVVQDWQGLHDAAGAILRPYDYRQYRDAFVAFSEAVRKDYDSITVENCTSDGGPVRTDYIVFRADQIHIIDREELDF